MFLAIATIIISGARLIDGQGGPPVENSIVVVEGDRIVAAGPRGSVHPPPGETFDARGLTLLPGLIDAHYHRGSVKLPNLFLNNGVTSVRDPGAWNQSYDPVKELGVPIPRLFLTGPHLDTAPPAYPRNSILVNDPEEARAVVHRFVDEGGATAIKVYFRLPLASIRAVCEAAHQRNVPVTAHLEIVRADDAIEAGLDGIEHVTSVGTAIADPVEAETFRQAVTADNKARNEGRYQLWSKIDLGSPRVGRLIDLMARRGVFFSPNLAVFERRAGERGATEMHAKACENMRRFTGMARKAGVRVVVGSHSNVPYAETGWAYHREMELMQESGMTPMEVIVGATLDNARFFRAEARLGSIEPGKLADLVLIEGDVLRDISSIRRVRRVMLNGAWIR